MNTAFQENQVPNTNLSYYRIRKWIGTFGILLPIFAPIIADEKLTSISHYYYTEAGVFFTSLLILIGVFLASYHGYDKVDNIITWVGGISIALVAIIPTPLDECCTGIGPTPICSCEGDMLLGFIPPQIIHFGGAVLFFICMAIMCVRQFTQGDKSEPGKKWRNLIYNICGYGIFATLGYSGVMIFGGYVAEESRFIFRVEVVMLVLFAAAWLLKGEALKDIDNGLEFIKEKFSKN
ncbi:MAG: hypothetical protein HWE21_04535 [Cytophagia bacterium]|nr:hypothetical protein [Cytophagia bacterium]NVK83563.1 hypothetical protein [Cytophagia bacterium]